MDVYNQVGAELTFPANTDLPGRAPRWPGFAHRLPAQMAKARRAFFHTDSLAGFEPVLRRGLLQVHHRAVVLLVTEQPAQAHRGLELAVHHRGPGVRAAFRRRI